MQKKSATICLLFAWLCANGAVSNIAQVLAWGSMFAGYAQEFSIKAALTRTFDASKPCDLCVAVAKTRGTESTPATLASSEKLFLACNVPVDAVVTASPSGCWPASAAWIALARIEPVAKRPPRA